MKKSLSALLRGIFHCHDYCSIAWNRSRKLCSTPSDLVARHGIQRNGVDAAEDAVFNVGVVALQAAEQDL